MSTIILELADDLAASLSEQSAASNISVEALSEAVLEQWLIDQSSTNQEPWSLEDVLAIEDGLAQARAGQTRPHSEICAELLAKVR